MLMRQLDLFPTQPAPAAPKASHLVEASSSWKPPKQPRVCIVQTDLLGPEIRRWSRSGRPRHPLHEPVPDHVWWAARKRLDRGTTSVEAFPQALGELLQKPHRPKTVIEQEPARKEIALDTIPDHLRDAILARARLGVGRLELGATGLRAK